MECVCAYCMKGLDQEGAPRCPTCESRHHLDCWRANGGCAVFGCPSGPATVVTDPGVSTPPGVHAGPPPSSVHQASSGLPAPYSPRERRLDSDYRQLMTIFAGHPNVSVEPRGAYPPERYGITLKVPGLRMDEHNRIVQVPLHYVELYLPAQYPREKPYATTTYPVFHPNFGAHICIADYWSPAQSLVDVVVQIADMLQYRQYNIHSPLNAIAANWVAENQHQVPVGNIDLMPADVVVTIHEEKK